MPAEFDQLAAGYDQLLSDPWRDRFTGAETGFFHLRKRDLIRDYFWRRGMDTRHLRYLDLGCGKGELLSLLRGDFASAAGCDTSWQMLASIKDIQVRLQLEPDKLPFTSAEFDFITAACVYHHVPPAERLALTLEVRRLLRPGGVFAIIEHNPYNPVTRLIVSRTPVDSNAILLKSAEARQLMREAQLIPEAPTYFLYTPEKFYNRSGRSLERWLARLPLGGQYAVFAIAQG